MSCCSALWLSLKQTGVKKNVSNLKCAVFLTFSEWNVSICLLETNFSLSTSFQWSLCNHVSQILAVRTPLSFRPWSVHTEQCFSAFRPSKILSSGAKCCSTCVKTLPFTSRSIPPLRPKKYNSPIVQFYLRSKGCHLTALWKPTAQALTQGRSSLLA